MASEFYQRFALILIATGFLVAAAWAGHRNHLDTLIWPDAKGVYDNGLCVVATAAKGIGGYACQRSNGAIEGIGWGMDEGYATYMQIAFRIFGGRVAALYWLYWSLVGISALAFVVDCRPSSAMLGVLGIFGLILFLTFAYPVAWFESTSSDRFLSSLCVLPALHLAFSRRWWVLIQLPILALAILVRSTAAWVPIAFVLLALVRPSRFWKPAVLTVAVGLTVQGWLAWDTDPRIAQNGFVAQHAFWHTLFYQFQQTDEWKHDYAAQFKFQTGDQLAVEAATQWAARNGLPRPVTQMALEQDTRPAWWEFVKAHPWFAIKMRIYEGPRDLLKFTYDFLRFHVKPWWVWPTLAIIGVLASGIRIGLVAFLTLCSAGPELATDMVAGDLTDWVILAPMALALGLIWCPQWAVGKFQDFARQKRMSVLHHGGPPVRGRLF